MVNLANWTMKYKTTNVDVMPNLKLPQLLLCQCAPHHRPLANRLSPMEPHHKAAQCPVPAAADAAVKTTAAAAAAAHSSTNQPTS